LKIEVYDRIGEVPQERWDALLEGRSLTFSHAFWELLERSGMDNFRCRHVLLSHDSGQACALATVYSTTTDIAIFAPPWLRGLLVSIRRIFPHFLKLRMLECGTPVTLNSPPFVVAEGADTHEVIAALHQWLHATARTEGHWVIVVRDFEPDAAPLLAHFVALGYHTAGGLPNAYLDIAWSTWEDYLASMQSYYRSKLLKRLRTAEEARMRHELVEEFAGLADTLFRQWLVVHESAVEFQREVLTPGFYRELAERMGKRSKVLLFYSGDQLIGHALLLHDGDLLRWLYFGRNQAANDGLYLYAGNAVIDTAIRLRVKRLEMGLTTYPIKQDLGARLAPIQLALRSPSRFIHLFVGTVYRLLNRTPRMRNKRIFKALS